MKKFFTVILLGGLLISCNIQHQTHTEMTKINDSEKNMKAFPLAQEGMERYVIYVEPKTDELLYKIEIIPGKVISVDCNHHTLLGTLEEKDVQGWGYTYYSFVSEGLTASTKMMCPDQKKTEKFITGKTQLIRYNSKLPIVVFAPKGFEIRYKIWEAGKENLAFEK